MSIIFSWIKYSIPSANSGSVIWPFDHQDAFFFIHVGIEISDETGVIETVSDFVS